PSGAASRRAALAGLRARGAAIGETRCGAVSTSDVRTLRRRRRRSCCGPCAEATFELCDVDAGDLAQAGDDEVAARLRVGEALFAVDGGAVLGDGDAPAMRTANVPPASRGRSGVEGVRAGAETEVVAAVPVVRVVARREAGARPAGDLVALEPGVRQALRDEIGHRALEVVVHRDEAAAGAPGVEGRAVLPGERVGGNMLGRERQRVRDVVLPCRERLTGNGEDEIEGEGD